jgi:hypothetical protein
VRALLALLVGLLAGLLVAAAALPLRITQGLAYPPEILFGVVTHLLGMPAVFNLLHRVFGDSSLLKNLAFGSTAALYLVLSALAGLWVWPLPSYSRALLVGLLWALLWLFLDWQAFGVGMGLRSFFGSQPLSDLVLVVDSLLAVSLAWWWRPRRRLMR